MEIEVKDQEKRVLIWLTHTEGESEELRKSLTPLFQAYKKKKYTVAVFTSGTDNLEELTRDLLLYNRVKLRELEFAKEKA